VTPTCDAVANDGFEEGILGEWQATGLPPQVIAQSDNGITPVQGTHMLRYLPDSFNTHISQVVPRCPGTISLILSVWFNAAVATCFANICLDSSCILHVALPTAGWTAAIVQHFYTAETFTTVDIVMTCDNGGTGYVDLVSLG
jgi:hypothetical protein